MSPPTPMDVKRRAVSLYEETGSAIEVAKRMEVSQTTAMRYLHSMGVKMTRTGWVQRKQAATKREVKEQIEDIQFPDFPDEDISVEDIIELQSKRYSARKNSHDAHTWFPVKVKDNKPLGIMWFGDPHVDDNGCAWPILKRHTELCKETDGLYGINIGDTTNCWGGRLIRKYADQDTSAKTARRLAEWFLLHSGVRWLLWLYGNHEHMGDGSHVLGEMAKRFGTRKIVMHDWEARFVLQFPNGAEYRISAAHDFPGNSMWNPLHGHVKAARFGAGIDLAVAGHKHNWGISQWELAEQESSPLMVRVRGYKHLDDFARKIGTHEQEEGQSILTIFNPNSDSPAGRIQAFVDVEAGADYLTFLRKRA